MKKLSRFAAAAHQPSSASGTFVPYRAPRYRVTLVCETEGTGSTEPIRDSRTAATLFRPCFDGLDREHFVVCGLDAKHRVIGINVVSVGSLSLSIVHPREVFKALILANAKAFICAHNHPSNDSEPSGEDIAVTQMLREAGKLLGIPLLDHVILVSDTFYSFQASGRF